MIILCDDFNNYSTENLFLKLQKVDFPIPSFAKATGEASSRMSLLITSKAQFFNHLFQIPRLND